MTVQEIVKITRRLTLLYAEDEGEIREESARFFEKFFNKVDAVANGREGLALFQKGRYDVVISDLKMPFMGGEKMLSEISKIDPDVITVAMCGLSGPNENELLVCDYCLPKPPEHQALMEMMAGIAQLKA